MRRRLDPRCAVCGRWFFPLTGYYLALPRRMVEVCSKGCMNRAWEQIGGPFWQHEI